MPNPAAEQRAPFADRLAALVEARRSQVCLGLDPDPAALGEAAAGGGRNSAAQRAAAAAAARCEQLIAAAGPACVAVKPQLACFERLGAPGREALEQVVASARAAGLLVVADAKRGDIPATAVAYAQALLGSTPTPWGEVPGLGADAATVNPLPGGDALEPWLSVAAETGTGLFVLVRMSNPGAADLFDLETAAGSVSDRVAQMVAERAGRLAGAVGLSGVGAVVGATEPGHLGRLRELMPQAVFLIPGVGAQGGRAEELGAALGPHPASILVTASRSIAAADDPAAAAESLRADLWELAQ